MNPSLQIPELEAMRMGVTYTWQIQLRNWKAVVRPLSIKEKLEVSHDVAAELARMPSSKRTSLTEHTLLARETLKRATCSSSTAYDPKLSDPILDEMTGDELLYVYDQYCAAEERVNPKLELMSKEQMQELVDEIKKKGSSASLLTELSFLQLVSLAHYFLSQESPQDK